MKIAVILVLTSCLVSCNTSIGVWRDTKAGVNWTKQKIQGSGGGYEQDYEYGAPVY